MSMTRAEHMKWAKDRALKVCADGDTNGAYASMASDMSKHDETRDHPAIGLGMMLMMSGNLSTQYDMKKFIEGFN